MYSLDTYDIDIKDIELLDTSFDYYEDGLDKAAQFDESDIDNPDIRYMYSSTRHMTLEQVHQWFDDHAHELSSDTVIVDTADGNSLLQYRELKPKVFVLKRFLDRVHHLDTLLNCASDELSYGGYLWCHFRTAAMKKQVILDKYPPVINRLVLAGNYIWHRICPKLKLTRKLYFRTTHGHNRAISRVEMLGRLYRAGFEVLDEGMRNGEFFVLTRKIKAPIWDDQPSISPIIKLRRVGKNGKKISVYKFRTMFSYSEYLQPYIYEHNHLQKGGKFADDYRINIWGKMLRKLWLDELPMLFNLLRGDIKLVGVRAISPHYFSLYTPEMQQLRTRVKPGLLPPAVAEKEYPETLEDIQESERRYIESYLRRPLYTDWVYFWRIVYNILFRGHRSN